MIQTGIESRIKIQDIVSNQLPEFVLDESPKTIDFLKQYYISQEYQGGPVDIVENLDQYLKVDNLTPEVVIGSTTLSADIDVSSDIISVSSTKGFPNQYGLLKIDDEVITYTGLTTNSFTGCVRGFSGITSYHQDLNQEELVFSTTTAESHTSESNIQNLSSLFLNEFYKKLKTTYTPGFENRVFDSKIDVGNFIKESRSFYESKGTDDSFRILFNVLYGETPRIINLEDYLIKPSDAEFIRREICVAEVISGDPTKIVGQTLVKTTDPETNASISSVESFTRNLKQYFKIGLFVGYAENSNVKGNFIITPSSKVLENVSVGSSVISVDSTIGFGQTGTIYSGNNVITYTDKSINQFLGCSGIAQEQKICPLMIEDEIDPEEFVEYKGKKIFMCCGSCVKKFKKAPDYYVKLTSKLLPQIDKSLLDSKIKIIEQKFCMVYPDRVVSPKSYVHEHGGKKYYFWSSTAIRKFKAKPDFYIERAKKNTNVKKLALK